MEPKVLSANSIIGSFLINAQTSFISKNRHDLDICSLLSTFLAQLIFTFIIYFCAIYVSLSAIFAALVLGDGLYAMIVESNRFASDLYRFAMMEDDSVFIGMSVVLGGTLIFGGILYSILFAFKWILKRLKRPKEKKPDSYIKTWWKAKREKVCFKVVIK